MIWVLNRTFFRPVNRLLKSREKHKNIEGGEAGSISAEASEKEGRYAKELLEARAAGYSLIESEQKKLARAREKKLNEIKAETAEKVESERAEIEQQAAEARTKIEADAGKIADEIAAVILKS
jgi:F-type H+-transporting ATPase subunit b